MNMSLAKSTRHILSLIDANSPTILTGLGVAGLITTVILAIKTTPKAVEMLQHELDFRYEEYSEDRKLTPMEIVDLTWKLYIPTAGMGVLTIGCIIGANHINLRRNAALASLYSIAETTLKEYQAKVVETIGEKKEEKLRGEIVQDKIDANPPDEKTIIISGDGDFLIYDSFSSRYFRSNADKIQRTINEFNQRLLREGWLNINYFYDELGLEPIELGDEMGWIAERELLEVKYLTKMGPKKEPCLVMEYRAKPHHF